MKFIVLLISVFSLVSFHGFTLMSTQKRDVSLNAKYEVLNQRQLTEEEIERLGKPYGIALAVRLRLTNISSQHILYLATSGTIVPTGYHLFRDVGTSEWKSTSPARGRQGPPGSEFTGAVYSWLELPPGAAVEIDAHDWSKAGEEHAFSTFVKESPDSKPEEITTNSYRPIE
jgi:hypothetical protein